MDAIWTDLPAGVPQNSRVATMCRQTCGRCKPPLHPAAAAQEAFLEVWENVLPEPLLDLAQSRHAELHRLQSRHKHKDRSYGWIDVAAAPAAVGTKPRDYVEAIVSSVVSASPVLSSLHAAGSLDVVEFFTHDRPQDQPQWFHFDTAEYGHFKASVRTVRNPSYSAIVYLTDEREAMFGLLGSRERAHRKPQARRHSSHCMLMTSLIAC